eukprot:TRINITY_DN112856_c0_g1_i1.p1 TRINITY_DN112856_c0_g1~~TRINITY_DN112856_c0_g1_i1.p1  ORF type:complete len:679 (+),score=85.38 TRINITY_DN112856_c0_g1_i1:31-2067(+)
MGETDDTSRNWHFEMLHDDLRNKIYESSICNSLSKINGTVLDIGAGSGLLSLMATSGGAKNVVACEMDTEIATVADEIVTTNGHSSIAVVPAKSTDLETLPGEDKADVIVTELFDSTLLGEQVLPTLQHAIDTFARNPADPTVIPAAATVTACLVQSSTLQAMVGEHCDDVVAQIAFNQLPDATMLCDPFTAFQFNFSQPELEGDNHLQITSTKPGTVHAVCYWWALHMNTDDKEDAENIISTAPDKPKTHWLQAAYFLRTPYKIQQPGETVEVTVQHDEQRIHFFVGDDTEEEGNSADEDGDNKNKDEAGSDSENKDEAGSDSESKPQEGQKQSEGTHENENESAEENGEEEDEEAEEGDEGGLFFDRNRVWMSNDNDRLETVLRAVKVAGEKKGTLCCIDGAGHLLHSVLNSRDTCAQFSSVLGLEWDDSLATTVRTANTPQPETAVTVDVVSYGAVEDFKAALPAVAESSITAVVSEVYFNVFASTWAKAHMVMLWHTCEKLRAAKLLADNALVAPRSATMRGQLVNLKSLWNVTRPVQTVCGWNLEAFNKFRRSDELVASYPLWMHTDECVELSEPFDLIQCDFTTTPEDILHSSVKCHIKQHSRSCNAVVLWVDYHYPSGDVSTYHHTGSGQLQGYWNQGVRFLGEPVALQKEEATIDFTFDVGNNKMGLNIH